jgi:hypothetical protein
MDTYANGYAIFDAYTLSNAVLYIYPNGNTDADHNSHPASTAAVGQCTDACHGPQYSAAGLRKSATG